MNEQKTVLQRLKTFTVWVCGIYACLLIFDFAYVHLTGQTPAQTLTVVTYSNITAASLLDGCDPTPNPCVDNRSQFTRQSSQISYRAISNGSGNWSVDMQWADSSPTGPWSSFGSTAQVNQSSTSGIGYGIGPGNLQQPYHNYIRFVMTGNVIILNYSGTRQFWWLPSVAALAFPITATQGGTVGAFVIDQLYSSISAACTAATSFGETVNLTKAWSVSTLTCNSALHAVNGGVITYTGQITFNGAVDGDLTPHFIPSGSPPAPIFNGPVAAFYPQWFGGKGDWNGSSGTDNCPAFTELSAIGSTQKFPTGQYYSTCVYSTTVPTQILGDGGGVNSCSAAKTCIVFKAGHSGFTFGAGSRGSFMSNLWVSSLDSGSNSDHGVEEGDSRFSTFQLTISGFGGDGLFCSASDPCDKQLIQQSYFLYNYGNGWHCGTTPDCNSGTIINNSAQNNGGAGFLEESGTTNTFIGNDVAGNTASGYDINGNSHVLLNNYCEAAGAMILRGVNYTLTNPNAGGCIIIDAGSGNKQLSAQLQNTIQLQENYGANNAYCAPASGSGTTYTCSPSPAMTTYTGAQLNFLPDVNGTPGAVTVNVSGLGAVAIEELNGSNPQAGDIVRNGYMRLTYDGTAFRISPTLYTLVSGNGGLNSCYGSLFLFSNTGVQSNNNMVQYCPGFGWAWSSPFWQPSSSPGLILYKSDNSGAGTASSILRLDATTSTNAQAPYAQINSAIQANTNGAQSGSLHLATAQSGTLTDVLVLQDNGEITAPALPSSAGSGGKYLCVDSSGNLYLKSSCP